MRTNTAIGALVVSGLAMPAVAQVSDAGVVFSGYVDFLDAGGVADSLNVSGGLELLPFSYSISASANVSGESAVISGAASWDVNGSLLAGGVFSSDFALSSSYGVSGSPHDPQGIISFASVRYDLLLHEASQVMIEVDVSTPSTSVFLVKVGGTTIFDSDVLSPGSASYPIDLPAGDIQVLFGNSNSNITSPDSVATFTGSLAVVPAPASGAVLGFAGVLGARRRR